MFARTPRLTLRPGWPEDAAALTAAIAHEDVATMLSRLPWPYTRAHAEEWLARPKVPQDLALLIWSHGGDVLWLAGAVGVHPMQDGDGYEIGYWLTPAARGRGYATEAGRAMLGIARYAMGLTRLTGGHFVDNAASRRVLTKLGFRDTGRVVQRPCVARGEQRACTLLERELDANDRSALHLAA